MTGVVMLVMLSVFEMPESDEVARVGAGKVSGAAGAPAVETAVE